MNVRIIVVLAALSSLMAGCMHSKNRAARELPRQGTEIIVCGQPFDIGTHVVLWTDPGGYDAYRTERRFAPWEEASYAATTQKVKDITSPARYGMRFAKSMTPEEIDKARAGWALPDLQQKVDQFVLHYDVAGTSRQCFKTLQDVRGLSVHFMLDIDGTIYQTLDLKERAFHATKANDRSVGIEIANMGAYGGSESQAPLAQWYKRDGTGKLRITVPERLEGGGVMTPNFVGRPTRDEMIVGPIRGHDLRQYDFTPEQYAALTKLTAALCTIFPKMTCDYPRDAKGDVIWDTLTDSQWQNYHGVLGHYHVQDNKADPGPAFQWETVIGGARKRMGLKPAAHKQNVPATMPTTAPSVALAR